METYSSKQNYSYEKFKDDLVLLQSIYPFIQQSSIGKSVLGRDIPEVLIGKGRKNYSL